MRGFLAVFFYVAALALIYCGFAVPASEGLNHHVMPQTDAEMLAALLIINGCAAKLMGHVMLFSTLKR